MVDIRTREILRLSWSPVFDADSINNRRFLYYKCIGFFLTPKGHVPLKRIVRSGLMMELVQDFMHVFVVFKFEDDPIKLKALSCPQYFSSAQEQITQKSMDGCVRNSNSFELLWLSW